MNRLIGERVIHPVSTRAIFFLVAHGAEAPFTLTALSQVFDAQDAPLEISDHVRSMVHLLLRSLVTDVELLERTLNQLDHPLLSQG